MKTRCPFCYSPTMTVSRYDRHGTLKDVTACQNVLCEGRNGWRILPNKEVLPVSREILGGPHDDSEAW